MNLPAISPEDARRLVENGGVLIDIREADEYAREHIPDAEHIALSRLGTADLSSHAGATLIFYCRSGARTTANQERLAGLTGRRCEAFRIEGGLEAWRGAGLPTLVDRRRPIELQRQVQISAGGLVVLGVLLSLGSPWFLALPMFVGAGLMFAGVSGTCGMARLLQRAPWNAAFSSKA
jgi:rhodanese-related sulfurtransferase